ncbi:hypothetical protein CDAR_319661 [Caerostris darwini]|uniref:LAGLIDADG homing endonuclease n=1 Tax=Caerostris darwini TaxID=1538125 RepID=A0AAV4M8B0_9ARAC|nr:hypothetical protein CDAR_319661 [Caerostris darwini]
MNASLKKYTFFPTLFFFIKAAITYRYRHFRARTQQRHPLKKQLWQNIHLPGRGKSGRKWRPNTVTTLYPSESRNYISRISLTKFGLTKDTVWCEFLACNDPFKRITPSINQIHFNEWYSLYLKHSVSGIKLMLPQKSVLRWALMVHQDFLHGSHNLVT